MTPGKIDSWIPECQNALSLSLPCTPTKGRTGLQRTKACSVQRKLFNIQFQWKSGKFSAPKINIIPPLRIIDCWPPSRIITLRPSGIHSAGKINKIFKVRREEGPLEILELFGHSSDENSNWALKSVGSCCQEFCHGLTYMTGNKKALGFFWTSA